MNKIQEQKLKRLLKPIVESILKEKIEYGDYGSDRVAWEIVNAVYDWKYKGMAIGQLESYLKTAKLNVSGSELQRKIKELSNEVVQINDRLYAKQFAPK